MNEFEMRVKAVELAAQAFNLNNEEARAHQIKSLDMLTEHFYQYLVKHNTANEKIPVPSPTIPIFVRR